jgi:hypothetical protein
VTKVGARVTQLTGQQLPLDPAGLYILKDRLGNQTKLVPAAGGGGMVAAVTPLGATSGFASSVNVTLPVGFQFPGTITAVTPDQQKAVVDLLDAPPVITAIASQPPVGGAPVRRLAGQQLSLDPAANYVVTASNGTQVTLNPSGAGGPVIAVQPVGTTSGFATQVDITFPNGFMLPGRLMVINPDGQQATVALS